jgi:ABC-type transporter Mla maintaining outer membrane lipid asymmetry ATPase subunit MlaF
MGRDELDRLRLRFGMNFQFGALLQSLTVGENVALPLLESGMVDPSIVDLVVKMKLELVGLTGFEDLKPSDLHPKKFIKKHITNALEEDESTPQKFKAKIDPELL